MAATLTAHKSGTIVLHAGGYELACTSLTLKMQLNSIPTATVVVGIGSTLGADQKARTENKDAEALLAKVLTEKDRELVDCEIYEVIYGTDKAGKRTATSHVIFKGVIVSGSIMFKTNIGQSNTIRAITFDCMNKACKLLAAPLSVDCNVCGAGIIQAIGDPSIVQNIDKARKADLHIYQGSKDAQIVIGSLEDTLTGKNLAEKMALITDAIMLTETIAAKETKADGTISRVMDYLYSNYTVDVDNLGQAMENSFHVGVCSDLLKAFRKASIYEAIKSVIVGSDYMLTLAPRFNIADKNQQFKLEIAPSTAWEATPARVLKASDAIRFASGYTQIASISAPEAYIVHFDLESDVAHGGTQQKATGANGVYSSNEALMEQLKKRYQSDQYTASDALNAQLFRTKVYNAPRWLVPAFNKKVVRKARDKNTPVSAEERRTAEDSAGTPGREAFEAALQTLPIIDMQEAYKFADQVAKAMYTALYGAGDSAIVVLKPSLRFGLDNKDQNVPALEDCIGKIIDIQISDEEESTANATSLNVRGMLEAIVYEYASNEVSLSTYTIKLSRIRPVRKDDEGLKCPLYTTTKKS